MGFAVGEHDGSYDEEEGRQCQNSRGQFTRASLERRLLLARDLVLEAARSLPILQDLSEQTCLIWLFTQFPLSLQDPKLETLHACRDNGMTPAEWFNATHNKPADAGTPLGADLPDVELPLVIVDRLDGSGGQEENLLAAERENARRIDGVPSLQRVFLDVVELSEELAFKLAHHAHLDVLLRMIPTLLPRALTLKIGVQVMLLFNLGPTLLAGTIGIVCAFEKGKFPEVMFQTDLARITLVVLPITQIVRLPSSRKQKLFVKITQLPLVPAFALAEALLRAVRVRHNVVANYDDLEHCEVLSGWPHIRS